MAKSDATTVSLTALRDFSYGRDVKVKKDSKFDAAAEDAARLVQGGLASDGSKAKEGDAQ